MSLPDDLLTAREIADRLKCRPDSIYRMMQRANVRAWRLGGVIRYSERDVATAMLAGDLNGNGRKRQPEARPYKSAS